MHRWAAAFHVASNHVEKSPAVLKRHLKKASRKLSVLEPIAKERRTMWYQGKGNLGLIRADVKATVVKAVKEAVRERVKEILDESKDE